MQVTAGVTLRPANIDDCRRIFEWRNDPTVIALSSSGKAVGWHEHIQWFKRRLNETDQPFFVINHENIGDIGVVRIDRLTLESHELTIYLLPNYMGYGYGPAALAKAVDKAFDNIDSLLTLKATIQDGNVRSIRMFDAIGFEVTAPNRIGSCATTTYELQRAKWLQMRDTIVA